MLGHLHLNPLLLLGLFFSLLGCLMVTNDTTDPSTNHAVMASNMSSESTRSRAPQQPAPYDGEATQPAPIKEATATGNSMYFTEFPPEVAPFY